jgi:pimeloyl-ACP methyl ester carboxylesterase
MLKRFLLGVALALVLAAAAGAAVYFRDMHGAYARIRSASQVIPSPFGDVEYAEGGSGPAVLVVHGSGGGFDQGELMVRTLLGDRFHWIAPSRFGYLRSTFHPGATFDDQADAYAYLLDRLGVETAAVVALSHGGPSALLLAVRHPQRVSSLTLVSAGVASSADPDQAQANQQGDALRAIFQQDVRYWAITHAFRHRFLEIMGADDAVIRGLTREQRERVDQVIDFMNPVSQRSAGAAFDNEAALPNERIAAIRAPTLILHARDDTLQLYRNAEYAAATIPGARLVTFERGGHLLMVVEQSTLRGLIEQHVVAHASR